MNDQIHQAKPTELLICGKCKEHGHLMKIYIHHHELGDGRTVQRFYNYRSNIRHRCMAMSEGNGF